MTRLQDRVRSGRFTVPHLRIAWLTAAVFLAVGWGGGALGQSEQGAEGIVHSAPVSPSGPELSVRDFQELQVDQVIPSASSHCSLDMIDDHSAPLALVIDHRVPITFVGWVADDQDGVPRSMVLLLIGDKTYGVPGTASLARPDVAAAKHNPAFGFSGYSVTGNPAVVPQGEYHLAVIEQFGSDQRLCPLGHTIAVK